MKNLEKLTIEELRQEVIRLSKEYSAVVSEFDRRYRETFTQKSLDKVKLF